MSIVFGPVPSRRLGYSLGIDILPLEEKLCTFNCIYCQVGGTHTQTSRRNAPIPAAEINQAIDRALPADGIDVVSFSGTGEPTLHKDLGQFIDRVKKRCQTPVAVLTNSSLIDRLDVRRDLAKADLVLPSLDAATQAAFEKINRPVKGLRIEAIIEGLERFARDYTGKMLLEIMLVKGVNDTPAELRALKDAVERIKPTHVHLNTVTRPPAENGVERVDEATLAQIAHIFGPIASGVGLPPTEGRSQESENLEAQVLDMVRRRGVTIDDLVKSLGAHRVLIVKAVGKLAEEQRIKKIVHGGVTYYREHY